MPESSPMVAADMQAGWWYWIGLLLCYGLLAMAEEVPLPAPRDWLRDVAEAMQRLDYQATVVYSRDNRIQTLRLAHVIRDGVAYERLQAMDGAQRQVVREADKVSCYFPDRGILIIEYHPQSHSLFNSAVPQRWDSERERLYRFQLGQRSRVAGRQAQEIVVDPLDSYRYGRRIWVDLETRLPLKFELLDHQNKVLEAFVVTELRVGEGISVQLEDSGHANWQVIDRKEETADRHWQLTRLPQGFQEVRRSRRLDPVDGMPVDHILISDGLASVSVYIKRDGGESFDPGNLRLGAVSVYSRRIDGHLITVLGDVPSATVRLIGEGVRQAQP